MVKPWSNKSGQARVHTLKSMYFNSSTLSCLHRSFLLYTLYSKSLLLIDSEIIYARLRNLSVKQFHVQHV